MNTRRINPSIHEINDTVKVMEQQWHTEPYRKYSIWIAILVGPLICWGIPIAAVVIAFHG